jgi:hypothetical protein
MKIYLLEFGEELSEHDDLILGKSIGNSDSHVAIKDESDEVVKRCVVRLTEIRRLQLT